MPAKNNDKVSFEWAINTGSSDLDLDLDLTYALNINIPRQNYFHNTMIDMEKLAYAASPESESNFSCHDKFKGKCVFPAKGQSFSVSVKDSIFKQYVLIVVEIYPT